MKPSNIADASRLANAGTGAPSERLQLGGLVLDLAAGELLTAEQRPAGLRRQALDLLLVLGRRAGQVVAKDELMSLVWPRVVVGEGSLPQAIADIRRALGDSEHRLVRNAARRGYLLMPDSPADVPPLSIAVMPLAIEGAAQDMDWFADALHGDLVHEVARLPNSLVIAAGTTVTYKGRTVDPRQVARELRVRHVVLGSLRHEGDTIRLKLSLIDGESGVQGWAELFVVERARLARSLAEFAMQLGRVLAPEFYRATAEQRADLSPLEVTADDLAMRATAAWFSGFTATNILAALQLAERAVALDPRSERGWADICIMSVHGVSNRWLADADAALRRIDEAVAHLVRLRPDGYDTYKGRIIQAFMRRDFAAMVRLSATIVERYREPIAFGTHGIACLMNGRADEAIAALEAALRLSPRDNMRSEWQYRLAMAHFANQSYELAVEWAQSASEANPTLPWPPIHAAALYRLGERAAARQAFAEFLERQPDFEPADIARRLPGTHATLVEARERLAASLGEVGMREAGKAATAPAKRGRR